MLLKHAQLSRVYQLSIKISTAPIFHRKFSYFSFVDKFPMFEAYEDEWRQFMDLEEIMESLKVSEEAPYDVSVELIAPDNAIPFKHEYVKTYKATGAELKDNIRKVLLAFKVYISVEFER